MQADAGVPARAGLVGHPSDGYGGATLSVTLGNFAAHVECREAECLRIEPVGDDESHEGAEPLIAASVRRFCRHCARGGVHYEPRVHIRYRSRIPREVGLAGSSALVIATLRALAQLSGVPIARAELPAIALAVETEELGIAAGPQDRIVQTLGGLVFMDFERGRHERLDATILPELFVAWHAEAPTASGAAHAVVRERHASGDALVAGAMRTLAGLAHDARAALERGDHDGFADALEAGFDVRARIFELDPRHTLMIDAARALGLPATYTGSGGAVVGIARDSAAVAALAERLEPAGVKLARATMAQIAVVGYPLRSTVSLGLQANRRRAARVG